MSDPTISLTMEEAEGLMEEDLVYGPGIIADQLLKIDGPRFWRTAVDCILQADPKTDYWALGLYVQLVGSGIDEPDEDDFAVSLLDDYLNHWRSYPEGKQMRAALRAQLRPLAHLCDGLRCPYTTTKGKRCKNIGGCGPHRRTRPSRQPNWPNTRPEYDSPSP